MSCCAKSILPSVGIQGATGAPGPVGPIGPQGPQGPIAPVAPQAGFMARQDVTPLAVSNDSVLERLSFFPGGFTPIGCWNNASGVLNYPDAFTVEILESGNYLVTGSASFIWGTPPSDPQTVQLAVCDSALTFFWLNQQEEIVVGTRQSQSLQISSVLFLQAGDLLCLAVQSISTPFLPGCQVIDGCFSLVRCDGSVGPTGPAGNSWTVGGNTALGLGAQRLGTNDTFIDLFEGEASVVIGGTAISRPNLHINGSLGVRQEVNTTTGTIALPAWQNTSFVRDQSAFTTVQLPPCSAVSADAARVMLVNSCVGSTVSTGMAVVPFPASGDGVLIQGVRSTSGVILPGRSTSLFLEVPGRNTWAALTQNPAVYQKQIYIPATPDPGVVTDWWLSNTSAGWSNTWLDGGHVGPGQGRYNSEFGVPQIRIDGIQINWETNNPGAGSGWQIRLYTNSSVFPAVTPATLIYSSNYTGTGNAQSYSLSPAVSRLGGANVWFLRLTVLGAGIPTKRCSISVSGYTPAPA